MSPDVEAAAAANLESPSEPQATAVAAPPIEHDDPIAAAFFQRPDRPVIDVSEELLAIHSMSRSSRRAMWATIGMFSLSLVCIAGYAGYHTIIMPVPAPLGEVDDHAVLPTPPESPSAVAAPAAAAPLRLRASLTDPTRPVSEPPAAPLAPPVPLDRAAIAVRPDKPAEAAPSPAPPATAAAPTAPSEPTAAPSSRVEGGAAEVSLRAQALTPGSAPASATETSTSPAAAPEPLRTSTTLAATSHTQPPTHDELLAVGRELSRKNRLTEAVEAFQRALIQAPDSSAALSGLSYVYLNASDLPRARDFAERSVDADATNSEGWIVLGAARELLGDRSGALAAYRTCVAQGKGRYLSQCRQVAR